MGRCKSLGILQPLLSYACQLSGASILRFDFSHPREWQQLVMAAPWVLDSRYCSSWAQKFTYGWLESVIAVTSLFIGMAENTPSLSLSLSHTHTHTYCLSDSSLCYTVGLCYLSVLYEMKSFQQMTLEQQDIHRQKNNLISCHVQKLNHRH